MVFQANYENREEMREEQSLLKAIPYVKDRFSEKIKKKNNEKLKEETLDYDSYKSISICVDSIKNVRNWDEIRLFLLDEKKNLLHARSSENKKKKNAKLERKHLFEKKEELITEEKNEKNEKKDQKNEKKNDQKKEEKKEEKKVDKKEEKKEEQKDQKNELLKKNDHKKELFKKNEEKIKEEKQEEKTRKNEHLKKKPDYNKENKKFKAFKATKSRLEKKEEPLSLLKISEELRRKIKTNDSNTEIPPLIQNLKRKRPQTSFFQHKKKVLLCKERIKQEPIEDNSKERTFLTSHERDSSLKERRNIKKYLVGSLLENDVPDHIITNTLYDIVNKTPSEKRLFLVEWKKREKGGKPQNSYCRGEDLKEKFPVILLSYYEKNAVFL